MNRKPKSREVILYGSLILICLCGCRSSANPDGPLASPSVSSPSPVQSGAAQSATPEPVKQELIWTGKSDGLEIRWTTVDLYAQSGAGAERIWLPLAQQGFEDFAAVTRGDQSSQEARVGHCLYERRFKVLSTVGSLVSFEDRYYDDCGGAHPSEEVRFTTVDLSKSGDVRYARQVDTPMMNVDLAQRGRIAALTDYFDEQDILRALLADRVVQKALATLKLKKSPETLAEVPELFANNYYALGDEDFELRPDFLTRFAFYEMAGEKIGVRLSLPPHSGANRGQHKQLGLSLSIPVSLQQSFALAGSRQQGFLMNHAADLAQNRLTIFRFGTGEAVGSQP